MVSINTLVGLFPVFSDLSYGSCCSELSWSVVSDHGVVIVYGYTALEASARIAFAEAKRLKPGNGCLTA